MVEVALGLNRSGIGWGWTLPSAVHGASVQRDSCLRERAPDGVLPVVSEDLLNISTGSGAEWGMGVWGGERGWKYMHVPVELPAFVQQRCCASLQLPAPPAQCPMFPAGTAIWMYFCALLMCSQSPALTLPSFGSGLSSLHCACTVPALSQSVCQHVGQTVNDSGDLQQTSVGRQTGKRGLCPVGGSRLKLPGCCPFWRVQGCCIHCMVRCCQMPHGVCFGYLHFLL